MRARGWPTALAPPRAGLLAALALAALTHATSASAETLFVIDQLVVNVSSSPGGEGDRVATIKSGDRVEVLDRQGEDTQIQLANGNQGWVKSSYLSSDPPLQRRLQDRTAEVEKLKQNVTRLEAQLAATRAAGPAGSGGAGPAGGVGSASGAGGAGTSGRGSGSGAVARSGAVPPDSGRAGSTAEEPLAPGATQAGTGGPATAQEPPPGPTASPSATHNGSLLSDSADPSPWPVWAWASGCSVIALAVGFLLGWRALDRRIRRKYGGLRIY